MLLPEKSPPELAESIFNQITSACGEMDVALVGGHSEITSGLSRPIVVGHMLGEVERERVVRTSGAIPGDALVLTKGIAIEGTAILAREAQEALRRAGTPDDTIDAAADLLFNPGISVVNEALAACEAVQVHSMHDPTEGGLATGLREIAIAARVGIEVDADSIQTFPACSAICDALGLDPLGLLASGALLITLSEDRVPVLMETLDAMSCPARVIGRTTDYVWGVKLRTNMETIDLPVFERDELARYLSQVAPTEA
jgi:hydrogenase maturation factor